MSSPGSGPPDDPPRSELTCDKFQWWVRQSGGTPLPGLLKSTGFGLAGAGLPCRGCLPRRRSGAGQDRCEGVRHVPWRGARASPSAPHRPERIERGGHVSGRRDALPPGRRWRLDDLDHPAFALPEPLGHKRSFSLPCVPERSLGGWGRQTVTIAGRKARRDVLSPGNRGFHRTFPTPGPASPVGVCAAQTGEAPRGDGRGELPDEIPVTREDRQQPQWPSRARTHAPGRTSLHHRCTEPRSSPGKRRKRVGRAAHRQASTPRYRAGHHPLPGPLPG